MLLREQKKEEKLRNVPNKRKRETTKMKKNKKHITGDSDSEEYEDWEESGSSLDDISDENFSDHSENETLGNEAETNPIRGTAKGDFYLVSFPGKKLVHKYVCCVQNIINANELEVQAFSPIEGDKTTFKIIEDDISVVTQAQLICKLEQPQIIGSGKRIRYRFSKEAM